MSKDPTGKHRIVSDKDGKQIELSEFADPSAEVEPQVQRVGRRYPSTIGGALFLCILLITAAGVAVAASGRWHIGVLWIGLALIAAGLIRLLLPEERAGMLHVRRRLVDVPLYIGMGLALVVTVSTLQR